MKIINKISSALLLSLLVFSGCEIEEPNGPDDPNKDDNIETPDGDSAFEEKPEVELIIDAHPGEKAPSGHHTFWYLAGAEDRIKEYRKGTRKITFLKDSKPISESEVQVELMQHEFKFGVSFTQSWEAKDHTPYKSRLEYDNNYMSAIKETFNYLTIGMYWGWIQSQGPEYRYQYDWVVDDTSLIIPWANENGYTLKGHPAIWHSTLPNWLVKETDTDKVVKYMKAHLKKIFAERRDLLNWDIYNEAPAVMENHVADSGVKRWVRTYCGESCYKQKCTDPSCGNSAAEPNKFPCKKVRDEWSMADGKHALMWHQDCINKSTADVYSWAHEAAGPGDKRVYVNNHYSDSSPVNKWTGNAKFYDMCKYFQENNVDYDVIGIQTHMHEQGDIYSEEELWNMLEKYSIFNKPIHLCEITIPSFKPFTNWQDKGKHLENVNAAIAAGRPIPYREGDESWREFQAEYLQDFYTLAFSHPNVEAMIGWSLSDEREWIFSAGGLLDRQDNPKKAYNVLKQLIKEVWHTQEVLDTDEEGTSKVNGFYGEYEARLADGTTAKFTLKKGDTEDIIVNF